MSSGKDKHFSSTLKKGKRKYMKQARVDTLHETNDSETEDNSLLLKNNK